MPILEIAGIIVVSAALARFLRRADSTAGLRRYLGDRSAILHKLVSCPHCLCFWFALACTVGVGVVRGDISALEFGLYVLAGWRGAYYLNRGLDHRREGSAKVMAGGRCEACGKPCAAEFLERRGLRFCSHSCWFDYLRSLPAPRERLLGPKGEILRQEIYPTSYADISSREARELLAGREGHTYIDVRSEPEFRNGHPGGAVNIPLMHREAVQMVPNPDFLAVVQTHFDSDAKLILGCQSGVRSVRAAEALVASGYTAVHNVRGGLAGTRNERGEIVERGWFELGLPLDYGDPEDRSYAALAGRR
ncbi:rhodanese-like domain-containing protein [Candidatus Latescibacterota bacterium]